MASYSIRIKASARKEIEAIGTKKDRKRIVKSIVMLASDPRPPGSQKLSGGDNYRIRVGHYRIVYSIRGAELVVLVVKVVYRKDVYR